MYSLLGMGNKVNYIVDRALQAIWLLICNFCKIKGSKIEMYTCGMYL